MIRQVAANLVLGVIVVSALVFYAPSAIQPKLSSLGGAMQHRIRQTNCWGYDEQWDCDTQMRSIPV
jgi:hypothetical protein